MRRKWTLKLIEHRGEEIEREVIISGPSGATIENFAEEFVEPLLLAWGYHPANVKGLFGEDEG